jgi:hypothetical protein
LEDVETVACLAVSAVAASGRLVTGNSDIAGGPFLMGSSPAICGEDEIFGGRLSGRAKFISHPMSDQSIANRKQFHSGKLLLFHSQSRIFIHPIEKLEENRHLPSEWKLTTCS